jgi:hypothetical protein
MPAVLLISELEVYPNFKIFECFCSMFRIITSWNTSHSESAAVTRSSACRLKKPMLIETSEMTLDATRGMMRVVQVALHHEFAAWHDTAYPETCIQLGSGLYVATDSTARSSGKAGRHRSTNGSAS